MAQSLARLGKEGEREMESCERWVSMLVGRQAEHDGLGDWVERIVGGSPAAWRDSLYRSTQWRWSLMRYPEGVERQHTLTVVVPLIRSVLAVN